jgi:putative heme iron utilization protein
MLKKSSIILVEVTQGVDSIALYYKSFMGKMAIEMMFFNDKGKVNRVIAHYNYNYTENLIRFHLIILRNL